MATMAEVARRAGVSITTVSHVVNRTRPVAPATVELVREAMAATGYRHNLAARALATRSTDTVGLAMSVVTNPYFGELVRDMEQQLRAQGLTLVLADTNDDPEVALDVIEHLMARRVSALVVNPLEGSPELTSTLEVLLADGFPVVLLDRRSALAADQVWSECEEAVRTLTTHLAEHGHRRVAVLAGTPLSMSAADRLTGYHRAVADLGLETGPELVLQGRSDEVVSEHEVARVFSGPDRPTALVSTNNQMTLGALRALKGLRLRVPDDVALVCYDDFAWADLFEPGITAMAQDVATLARSATDLLLQRIEDPTRTPVTTVVPTRLHLRSSCGCPPDLQEAS